MIHKGLNLCSAISPYTSDLKGTFPSKLHCLMTAFWSLGYQDLHGTMHLFQKTEAPLQTLEITVEAVSEEDGKVELLLDNNEILTVPLELLQAAVGEETLNIDNCQKLV